MIRYAKYLLCVVYCDVHMTWKIKICDADEANFYGPATMEVFIDLLF